MTPKSLSEPHYLALNRPQAKAHVGNGGGTAIPVAQQWRLRMSHHTDLIDRYIAMWNETDAKHRRDIIAKVWTEDASYVDPVMRGDGRAGIDAMVQGLQERFPGHRMRRTSDIDAVHDRVRFSWE